MEIGARIRETAPQGKLPLELIAKLPMGLIAAVGWPGRQSVSQSRVESVVSHWTAAIFASCNHSLIVSLRV